MAFDAHKNFAYSLVATAPSPATSGTSLVVTAADGAKFPAASFNATVWPAGAQPSSTNAEIVRVTAISTDTFTITRTQESTSARTIVVGDQIAANLTVKTVTDLEALAIDTVGAGTDITTNNASTTKHGLLKKLDNTATNFMDGTGAWSVPAGTQFVQLADSTLGSSQANFDMTSISASYAHLLVMATLRDDGAVATSSGNLRFNNDSAGNYDDAYNQMLNTTNTGGSDSASASLFPFRANGANASASAFGNSFVFIPNYAGTTAFKAVESLGGAMATSGTKGTYQALLYVGQWRSTAAINRITIYPGDGTNWVTGSRVTLYGLK